MNEALVNATLFLDTGDQPLATEALARHEDAKRQRQMLAGYGGE